MLKSVKHDNSIIENIAKTANIDVNLCVMLVDKGYDNVEKIKKFLKPSLAELTPLDDILGAREIGAILLDRVTKGKKVVVFGDYDCDGICSIAMLKLFFMKLGYEIEYLIPDRNIDGYGLRMESVTKLIDMGAEVVITVDCGIGSLDEIAYLTSKGIEMLVTDHHELPTILPNCVICNPKTSGGAAADMCGAGVVLRIIESMSTKKDMVDYLDICAIATIGDIVPLTADNRIIAKLGLDKLNLSRRAGIRLMTDKCAKGGELSASDISYFIVPRINAAGRMENAMSVPKIFFEKDFFELETLIDRLNLYNIERQELCEKIYQECLYYFKNKKIKNEHCLVFCNDEWEVGVLGITCARLSKEFNLPVILFGGKGELLKGSARGIPSVNLYGEMKKAKELTISFGGHIGACGVTVTRDNYEAYKSKIEKIFSLINYKMFIPKRNYDYEIVKGDISINLCYALKDIEPCGAENQKPTFLLKERLTFERIKLSEHLKASQKGADILAFSSLKYLTSFTENCKVNYYLDLSLNDFRGKYTAQGLVKNFEVTDIYGICGEQYDINYYKSMLTKTKMYEDTPRDSSLEELVNITGGVFGTVFVARRVNVAKKFLSFFDRKKKKGDIINIAFDTLNGDAPCNTLLFYGGTELDLSGYTNVVFLDPSPYGLTKLVIKDADIHFACDSEPPIISELDIRDIYLKINEYLFVINDEKEQINGVNSLFMLLQKNLNCDNIKFNIIFDILYARHCVEVINKRGKTFFIKLNKYVAQYPTAYDMWINVAKS